MNTRHESKPSVASSELDHIHASPENWYFHVFYFASLDPRIIVKKRLGVLGWTLNFARPLAVPTLLGLVTSLMSAFKLAATWDLSQPAQFGVAVVIILALVNFCRWMANPKRFYK
ncbi:MAG: hypothetical protein JWR15_8 [Prosthecobacter sp.]|nr:hypothetical protein [Prosthecobacter sp.]